MELGSEGLPNADFVEVPLYVTAIDTTEADEYFEKLRAAEREVFKWLRDEYHSYLSGDDELGRVRRASSAVETGEDWYKNFQCKADNKSCDGQVSEQQQQQRRLPAKQLNVEKLHRQQPDEGANGKNMNAAALQQQVLLSGHRHYYHHDAAERSNGNDVDAINRLLHAKTSQAAQRNEVREIELKHQHLTASSSSSSYLDDEKFPLSDNQLPEPVSETQPVINVRSSNSNFHSPGLDTSSDRAKRSSGHRQTRRHYDDQFNPRRNSLLDELEDVSAGRRQQRDSSEPRTRVKRRDAINQINRNDGLVKSIDYENDGSRLMNYVINPTVDVAAMDNNLLNDEQHVNTSAALTATQEEMNNGNEKVSNDNSDGAQTANNEEKGAKVPTSAASNAKVMRKRDTGDLKSHSLNEHLRALKGRHSVSDLISGELPNEIVRAAHNLVNSNELLRQYIKPHLVEPQYSLLREPNPLKSNQMANLVSYLNELVSDQVRMRSCIQLPPELQRFYNELMQRERSDEGERDKKSVEDFLMTRRKFKRNAHHNNRHQHSRLELEQKCERVHILHDECLKIDKCTTLKPSLIQYFKGHEEICGVLRSGKSQKQHKRSLIGLMGVTPEFAKLYNYKNYFLESNVD